MNVSKNLDSRLLAFVGQHFPGFRDASPSGRGPLPDPWTLSGNALAALNPQPLPPLPAFEFGVAVATEFMRAAWLADRLGLDLARIHADFDGLCRPPPDAPKLPWGWWRWWREPVPHPNELIHFRLGLASRLAAGSLDIGDGGRLGEFMDAAAKKSGAALESALGAAG